MFEEPGPRHVAVERTITVGRVPALVQDLGDLLCRVPDAGAEVVERQGAELDRVCDWAGGERVEISTGQLSRPAPASIFSRSWS